MNIPPSPNFVEIGKATAARAKEYEIEIKRVADMIEEMKKKIDENILLILLWLLLFVLFFHH